MEVWGSISLAILVCGLLYGLASYLVQEVIVPSNVSSKKAVMHHIKITGLFTYGAYFFQGKLFLNVTVGITTRHLKCRGGGLYKTIRHAC